MLAVALQGDFSWTVLLKNPQWKPSVLFNESLTPVEEKATQLAVVAHIFHMDFVPKFLSAVRHFPNTTTFLITTPDRAVLNALKTGLYFESVKFEARLTPNRGRNFGPILVEFGKELLNYDAFIHLHSKKSSHAKPSMSHEWIDRCLGLLMSRPLVDRTLELAALNQEIGIIYPNVADLQRRINFRWGISRTSLRKVPSLRVFDVFYEAGGPLAFPAGGMFWARTAAVRPILEFDWEYEMFPQESGQLDGELHHAVERLFGVVPRLTGYQHAVYVRQIDRFTPEVGYCV